MHKVYVLVRVCFASRGFTQPPFAYLRQKKVQLAAVGTKTLKYGMEGGNEGREHS